MIVALLLFTDASAGESGCLSATSPTGVTTKIVTLKAKVEAPYFYYRSFDFNYVLLVSADSLSAALNTSAQTRTADIASLRTAIKRDLPLTQSADLFRYVLMDPYRFSVIQKLMVELLYRGDVAVMYAPLGDVLASVTVRQSNQTSGSSRDFFGPNDARLMWSLDCIED
jgi:hypothetical protein